jgi:hypothetical protein
MTQTQHLHANQSTKRDHYRRLKIVRGLIGCLETSGILYCHWKSNEHLDAAVAGDTDLDILFEEAKHARVVELVRQAGFVPFRTVWFTRYPGIEDFIGIDNEKGKMVHIHAHFQLILGEKRVKSYHLPWEDDLLKTRIWDEKAGIYRSDPTLEILLLVIREAIKLRKTDRRPWKYTKYNRAAKSGSDREIAWLRERVSLKDLHSLAEKYCGPQISRAIDQLYREGLSSSALADLRRLILPAFQQYRRYHRWHAAAIGVARESSFLLSRAVKKTVVPSLPIRRIARSKGLIIAVLGADGSGKSTVSAEVARELSTKIDVMHLYMGSGNGPGSLMRWPVDVIRRAVRGLTANRIGIVKKTGRSQEETTKWKLRKIPHYGFQTMWALTLAREKRLKLKRAWRARQKGVFVICDRYPQTDIEGYNDGPLLGRLARSELWFLRLLGYWERSSYAQAAKYAPDLVVRLLGHTHVLAHRRPEMSLETISRKQEGIRAIQFPRSTRIVEIDAGKPLEEVITGAMGAVGNMILSKTDEEPRAFAQGGQIDRDDR